MPTKKGIYKVTRSTKPETKLLQDNINKKMKQNTSISFVFVWLLFPLLPVSVDWSFSIALSVFSNVYFQYIYDLRGSILPAIVQEYQHGRCKLHLYIICIAKLPSTLTTDIHVVFSSWLCYLRRHVCSHSNFPINVLTWQ